MSDEIKTVWRAIHKSVCAVSDDLDKFHFNKAIARIRELTNTLDSMPANSRGASWVYRRGMETVVKLLGPIVPHIAEEMWLALGYKTYVVESPWPDYDEALLVEDTVTVGVQVNGKMRGAIELPKDCDQVAAEKVALGLNSVKNVIKAKEIRKIIFVPNRILNIVI
jgi:leucyl-tRNA synthetase